MFVITSKESNIVINYGNQLDYMSNGYPRLVVENIAFPTHMVNVYEVDSMPETIEPEKYCYTPGDGFYENPQHLEPVGYGIDDELVEQIKNDAITEVEEAVLNGTYK